MAKYKVVKVGDKQCENAPVQGVRPFSELTEEEQKKLESTHTITIHWASEQEKMKQLKRMSALFDGLPMPKARPISEKKFLEILNS